MTILPNEGNSKIPNQVSFFDPTAEADVKRKRLAAQLLTQQSQQDGSRVVNGLYLPDPQARLKPWIGLAGAVSNYQAGQQENDLNTQKQALYAKALSSRDPYEAASTLGQDPSSQDSAVKLYGQALSGDLLREKLSQNGGGGATGALIQQYMQAVPNATFEQALYAVKNGVNANPELSGQVAGAKQQATSDVDLVMDPQIALGTQNAKNQSDLQYNPQIKQAEVMATNNANQMADLQKKATGAANSIGYAEQARNILQGNIDPVTGQPTTGLPTGSGMGALLASGKGLVGKSDESTQANAQLDIVAGNLLNNVPRMEGPQSDADLRSYQAQAGKVGDRTIPVGDRLAALKEIDRINAKYANIQTTVKDAMGQGIAPNGAAPSGGLRVPVTGKDVKKYNNLWEGP